MKKRAGDILKLVVFLGIGIFFIYWFLLKLDAEQKEAIWEAFKEADYGWVIAAMGVSLLSHWVRALRWRLLYEPLGLKPNMNNTFGSVVVAYMANLAFPRLGEVARCATMRTSEHIPLEKSLGTVVTERIIDVVMFGVVIVLGLLLMYNDIKDWLYDSLIQKYETLPSIPMLAAIGVAGLAAAVVAYKLLWKRLLHIPLIKKVDTLVRNCIDGVVSILHLGGRNTWLFVFYSIMIYLLYILGGLLIMQAFEESAGLGMKAAFAIYLFGSVGMVFSQGGLGVYPVLVQLALGLYAVPLATGTAAGWMLWGSQQVVVLTVGFGYLIYFSLAKHRQANQELNRETSEE